MFLLRLVADFQDPLDHAPTDRFRFSKASLATADLCFARVYRRFRTALLARSVRRTISSWSNDRLDELNVHIWIFLSCRSGFESRYGN